MNFGVVRAHLLGLHITVGLLPHVLDFILIGFLQPGYQRFCPTDPQENYNSIAFQVHELLRKAIFQNLLIFIIII